MLAKLIIKPEQKMITYVIGLTAEKSIPKMRRPMRPAIRKVKVKKYFCEAASRPLKYISET